MQRGKIVTLIGPNGSGKSTILKTVIGQLPELSGTVYLDGETLRSRSRRRSGVYSKHQASFSGTSGKGAVGSV